MDKQTREALSEIARHIKGVENKQPSNVVDLMMRVAASVSTIGICAVFALFFTTIPDLKSSIERLSWQNTQLSENIQAQNTSFIGELAPMKEFMREPRFTLEKYSLYEREQRLAVSDMRAKLELLQETLDKKEDTLLGIERRLSILERIIDDSGG